MLDIYSMEVNREEMKMNKRKLIVIENFNQEQNNNIKRNCRTAKNFTLTNVKYCFCFVVSTVFHTEFKYVKVAF